MNRMKYIILCCLLVVPFLTIAFVVPPHDARVTDLADIFTDSEEASLEVQLQAIETAHQAEIAVLTLSSLEGNAIEEVAIQIAQEWGIGKAQADNGVLIAIAPTERERRIEVGYGLEGVLPDITAGQLGRSILVPAFQAGDYYGGVSALIEVLSGVVAGTYDPALLDEQSFEDETLTDKLLMGLIMVVFISFFLSVFVKGIAESRKKKPDTKQKQKISGRGSVGSTILGILVVGGRGLLYILPAYLIWRMIMSASGSNRKTPTGGRSSGGGGRGGGGGGSSFGGFGGGSFGGGGAGGSW